jgi:hypothetical protein
MKARFWPRPVSLHVYRIKADGCCMRHQLFLFLARNLLRLLSAIAGVAEQPMSAKITWEFAGCVRPSGSVALKCHRCFLDNINTVE